MAWVSRKARWLILGLFVVQAGFLACTVNVGTPPDETNHVQFIQYYAHHSWSPIFNDQTPTYNLGDKTREVDYLYHYTMSFVYRISPFSEHATIIVIRMFSVAMALLTFLVLANVFRRLGFSEAVTNVALLIITNLPMVLMMSSAVNNDVTVWLGASLGLLLLLRLWEKPRLYDLMWLFVLTFAGGLLKRTLLPLGFIFGILGIVLFVRRFSEYRSQIRLSDWKMWVLGFLLVLSVGLFMERVGDNTIRYHTPAPTCNQVQGEAACSVFWGNIREATLSKQAPEARTPVYIFPFRWLGESLANVVDIQTQGWRHEVMPARWLTPFLGTLLVTGVAYGFYADRRAWHIRADRQARWRLYSMIICLYFMTVHMLVNYSDYRHIGFFGVALNGRYILPSLLPLIGFACFYWSRLLVRHPRWRVVLATLVVLGTIFGSGLLMMARNPQLFHS